VDPAAGLDIWALMLGDTATPAMSEVATAVNRRRDHLPVPVIERAGDDAESDIAYLRFFVAEAEFLQRLQ